MNEAQNIQGRNGHHGVGSKLRGFIGDYSHALSSFSPNARRFLLGQILLWIGANQISLLLSLYLKRIGYSEDAIGGVLATKALGTALVVLPASLLAARFNLRLLLPVSAFLTAAAYAAQALGAAGSPLLAAAFLSGAFSTVFQVSAGPFFIRNSGESERMHLFSINGALSMGTGVIGSSLGGLLKDGAFAITGDEIGAYRFALVVGCLFLLSAWIPFSKIEEVGEAPEAKDGAPAARVSVPEARGGAPDAKARKGAKDRKAEAKQVDRIPPSLWLRLLLPGFLIGTGAGLTIPYLNLYFKDMFSLEDGAIGVAVAAGQIATFIGMASGPALARRIGKPWAVVGTQIASVPLILVLAWIHSLPLAIIAYLLRQALMNLATPIQDIFLLELVPRSRMIFLNAVRTLVWNASWTIAARLSGWFIWKGGFGPSFTLTAALYTFGTALFWLFFVRRTKPVIS
ncbi:MAG TPA: MFS transporter [Rectinemataceae bacterium]|nr:MFS transporter [Rectinemataceae bacterium]